MWLKTKKGNYVNLQHAYYIFKQHSNEIWHAIALFCFSHGDQDEMKIERIYLYESKNESEIDEFLNGIGKKLFQI